MRLSAIALLLLFAAVSTGYAQNSRTEKTKAAKQEELKKEKSPQVYDNPQPYDNYKRIKNREEAKEAWIKDHPEEYQKLGGSKTSSAGNASSGQTKEEWIKAHPREYQNQLDQQKKNYKPSGSYEVKTVPVETATSATAASLKGAIKDNPNAIPAQPVYVTKGAPLPAKLPNVDKRLPANYDDSKTNVSSKE